MPDIAQWRKLASDVGFELEMFTDNPIDRLWSRSRPSEYRPRIVDYPVCYAGESSQSKCEDLVEHLNAASLQALLVADPEDVSWLLNVRAVDDALKTEVGDWHVVPSCTSRALVQRDGSVAWFVHEDRLAPEVAARSARIVTVAPPDRLAAMLREIAGRGSIATDLHRTPAALTAILEDKSKLCDDNAVARRRWRKYPSELEWARKAHIIDAAAVVRFAAWLTSAVLERAVSEFEAAEVLEAFRAEHYDYKGASMPLMSASGPNAAQPHYVPHRQGSRNLADHPIYWMDSGGHYPGGTTDNTITLALSASPPRPGSIRSCKLSSGQTSGRRTGDRTAGSTDGR